MTRDEALQHCRQTIEWLNSLESVDSKHWLEPITEGKWSVAEVIAHLFYWDRYILEERIPIFLSGGSLPKPPEVEAFNANAAAYARSGVGQMELLHEIVRERNRMLNLLSGMTDEQWTRPFRIKEREVTLGEYLFGFAEHDRHHQDQINEFLANP
jgi:uncharacterized damage-inducible protein DinB